MQITINSHIPTPHNAAKTGEIAPFTLLPGDPLRAKYVAEHYLENAKQVTGVRGMLGFTGTFNGKPVSVMGSGMGGPSAGIYTYELFAFYGVEHIVRIGTAGGFQTFLKPGDLVLAMTACTDSNYAYQYKLPGTFCPCGDFGLLRKAAVFAENSHIGFKAGSLFSSDMYSEYNALGPEQSWKPWAAMGCLAQDMETYALYCNAAYLRKSALSIVTNVCSCITGEQIPPAGEAMKNLEPMIRTALSLV
jgi:purine-nucleoside phosphorylase